MGYEKYCFYLEMWLVSLHIAAKPLASIRQQLMLASNFLLAKMVIQQCSTMQGVK